MTTINTLATTMHHMLDLSEDSAASALRTYISQIEQEDGRTIDEDQISDTDAEFLIGAVKAGRDAGDLGTTEIAALEDHMRYQDEWETQRDRLIRDARAAGASVKDLTGATGLSRSRIYTIIG